MQVSDLTSIEFQGLPFISEYGLRLLLSIRFRSLVLRAVFDSCWRTYCSGLKFDMFALLYLKVKETGIPMPGRIIHNLDGKTSFIPYGKKGQVWCNMQIYRIQTLS